jgi:hypothetical protein
MCVENTGLKVLGKSNWWRCSRGSSASSLLAFNDSDFALIQSAEFTHVLVNLTVRYRLLAVEGDHFLADLSRPVDWPQISSCLLLA